jgi:hypothetical protein
VKNQAEKMLDGFRGLNYKGSLAERETLNDERLGFILSRLNKLAK